MRSRSLLTLISVCVFACMYTAATASDVYKLAMSGGKLTAKEAAVIEAKVEKNPSDVDSRTILLGYYFGKQYQDQSARAAKCKHILWLIKNSPEADVLGIPYGTINPYLDSAAYAEGKKAWLDQLKKKPENVKLLENTANFARLQDRELGMTSLQKAQSLEPKNPKWPSSLGRIYSLEMTRGSLKARTDTAEKALKHYELAYMLSAEEDRDVLLGDIAETAFVANQPKKAKKYAEEMLSNNSPGWNYGNNIHQANLILGRLALAAGDTKEAKKYLLNAGKTPGSPQLNSFGPNMALAKELLQKGETDIVLEYFVLCSTFWKMKQDRLDKWAADVKAGKVPDFGANLNY